LNLLDFPPVWIGSPRPLIHLGHSSEEGQRKWRWQAGQGPKSPDSLTSTQFIIARRSVCRLINPVVHARTAKFEDVGAGRVELARGVAVCVRARACARRAFVRACVSSCVRSCVRVVSSRSAVCLFEHEATLSCYGRYSNPLHHSSGIIRGTD